jgi:excisionase family DNA binding protein
MGSTTFISKDEAADRLGVSDRTIYRYMKKGVLRTQQDGRRIVVSEEDVDALKRYNDEPSKFALSKPAIVGLFTRVEVLESHVSTMLRILNIQRAPLNWPDTQMLNCHEMVKYYAVKGWPAPNEESFVDTFARFSQDDMEQLARVAKKQDAWIPWYKLACTMYLRPYNREFRDLLAYGKSNLHTLAGVWTQLKGGTPAKFRNLIATRAIASKRLLRNLDVEQAKGKKRK